MKTLISFLLSFFIAPLLLVSCGNIAQEEYPLSLKLELPATLVKGEKRREKFMERADILTVKIKTQGGENLIQSYAKTHWEKILLPSFEFPRTLKDKMEVSVEVHAKNEDGTRTTEAVLKGEGTFSAGDVEKGAESVLTIKLSLTVQPETWD